jgi:uncharacterized protein YggU (UPF0235/DUF167 family)
MKIEIKVKTNSRKSNLYAKEGKFYANLKSSPENNKANLELIKLVNKYFETKSRIVFGHTNKKKVLEIT